MIVFNWIVSRQSSFQVLNAEMVQLITIYLSVFLSIFCQQLDCFSLCLQSDQSGSLDHGDIMFGLTIFRAHFHLMWGLRVHNLFLNAYVIICNSCPLGTGWCLRVIMADVKPALPVTTSHPCVIPIGFAHHEVSHTISRCHSWSRYH